MALFKPLLGDESRISLEVTPFHEGYVYFVKEGFLYFDVDLGTTDEPNQQRIKLRADADVAKKLVELNNLSEMAIWIGTSEEYNAIETKEENVLYIVPDDFQDVTFEDKSNKVTALDETCTDVQYPSAKAVFDKLSNLDSYEDVSNKITSLSSVSTDVQYPSAKAVYNALLLAEKFVNKITVIDDSVTDDQYASALAIYNFVQSCIEEYIASTPTITSSTSAPTSDDGKVNDIWVVI